MQQIAQFDIERLDEESINKILAPFKGRHVEIVVKEVKNREKTNQFELYEQALKVRERFKDSKIDPNIDLSALANEVNL